MKLISWNVNGLRAVAQKGFSDIFTAFDADFFCLQETKLQEGQIDLEFLGYQSYWNYAEKKGYSGTATYTRHTPLSVTRGIGVEEHDHEGRVLTLEMPDFYLVNVYTPNSQDGLRRLDYRMQWEDAFRAYVRGLTARKGVVICGDMNVAHEEIDLKNPATNHFNAGFSDEERAKMSELLPRQLARRPSGRGQVLLVVLPDGCPRTERGLAHRLFSRFRRHGFAYRRDRHPQRHFRLRPLPGGAGAARLKLFLEQSAGLDVLFAQLLEAVAADRFVNVLFTKFHQAVAL